MSAPGFRGRGPAVSSTHLSLRRARTRVRRSTGGVADQAICPELTSGLNTLLVPPAVNDPGIRQQVLFVFRTAIGIQLAA